MKIKIFVTLMLTLSSVSAYSHHSATMFDNTKVVDVTGVVKEFQYSNPHSWLLIDVTNADGSVITWGFEAEGPSSLLRAGIRKNDLPPGKKISIRGNPMRDGRPAAAWIDAVVDGNTISPRNGFAVNPASE